MILHVYFYVTSIDEAVRCQKVWQEKQVLGLNSMAGSLFDAI